MFGHLNQTVGNGRHCFIPATGKAGPIIEINQKTLPLIIHYGVASIYRNLQMLRQTIHLFLKSHFIKSKSAIFIIMLLKSEF